MKMVRFITVKGRAGKRAVPIGAKSPVCPVKIMPSGMGKLKAAVATEHADRLMVSMKKIQTAEGLDTEMQREGKKYAGDEDTVRRKFSKYLTDKYDKMLAEDIDRIVEIEGADDFKGELAVTVEWKKSRMWGSNPTAHTSDGDRSESIGGCGYDKESTAIAEVLNRNLSLLKLMYGRKNKDYKQWEDLESQSDYNHKVLGYGSGYSILPRFEGGVGVSSHQRMMENLGLEMRNISSTDRTDTYMIRKAKK